MPTLVGRKVTQMLKVQVVVSVNIEIVTAMVEEAKAAGMKFPDYCRKIFEERVKTPPPKVPVVPFTSAPVTKVYDEKTFAEFQDMRRRCDAWEVKLWLQNHPGFDPKVFRKGAAKAARKRPAKS